MVGLALKTWVCGRALLACHGEQADKLLLFISLLFVIFEELSGLDCALPYMETEKLVAASASLLRKPLVFSSELVKGSYIEATKQTNKHLRCGNRKGLLGRNDQTHHRMGPKTMDSTPPINRNTQAYNQQITRRIYLFPNQTQSRAPTKQNVQ